MNHKNKKIKWMLIITIILIILGMENKVKAFPHEVDPINLRRINKADPIGIMYKDNNDGLIKQVEGSDIAKGYYFFCRNESIPWNFYYTDSQNLVFTLPFNYWYDQVGNEVDLEPTINFGLYTAKQLGMNYDLEAVQRLIWGSVKYSYQTCSGGNPNWYGQNVNGHYSDDNHITDRADQFGMFYYGVLGGGTKDPQLSITEGDKANGINEAKAYVDQEDKSIILGPYQINITFNNVTNLYNSEIETNLYRELAGKNIENLYPNKTKEEKKALQFADYELEVDGAKSTEFLDQDGNVIVFPNFNRNFYIKCKIDENNIPNFLTPKITLKYVNETSGTGYIYESVEDVAEIPGMCILDKYIVGYDDGCGTAEVTKYIKDSIKSKFRVRNNEWNKSNSMGFNRS